MNAQKELVNGNLAKLVKVLIVDLVTLQCHDNNSDAATMGCEVADFISQCGAMLHHEDQAKIDWSEHSHKALNQTTIHFFYLPHLSAPEDIAAITSDGQYDAVIAAATIIPCVAKFPLGGVRIGAGTGNMQSESFALGAPLMNTPSFNSQVTAQMAFKAILNYRPQVDWQHMHSQVVAGRFDTGRDLAKHPTKALFGSTIAILGFGHIGREVAKLANSFGMKVRVFARAKHQVWIESLGYQYCQSPIEAATGADILSPHLGLGAENCNVGLIENSILSALNDDALVVNFDRGELININALQDALIEQKVSQVVVDADIFVAAQGDCQGDGQGNCTGPLQAYRQLADDYGDKLLLLPHVAADIDHLSRIAGAKQAIKQMITVITDKVVINGVGDIPCGYRDGGKQTLKGIGAVDQARFESLDNNQVKQMAVLSANIAQFWQTVANGESLDDKIDGKSKIEQVTLEHNQLTRLLASFGLTGVV